MTPLTRTQLAARIARDIPEGAYVNLFATHQQISTMIADDRVQGVSLTGSEQVGAIVAEQAGRALKKCVLELGGADVFLVLDTDDVDLAVKKAVMGRIDAQARETVKIEGKKYNTIRYEAHLFNGVLYRRSGRLFVWLTDDDRRLPVQIKVRLPFYIGTVTLQLKEEGTTK